MNASEKNGSRIRGLETAWPELLVFMVALAFRMSLVLRLHHSILEGTLLGDEHTYWTWSDHILRAGPVGPNAFFMGPLYPYALALLRLVFQIHSPFGVLVIQALLGAVACAVLTNASRRLAAPPIAALAGLLVAGYEIAIFHDALVLMESLLFFIASWLVWAAIVAAQRGCGRTHALALGALVGVLSQGRALFALLLPCLWPILRTAPRARRPARAVLAAAAFIVVCAPTAWHNARVTGAFIPFTYNFGMNLYIGNHPNASGTFEFLTDEPSDGETIDDQGGAALDGRSQLQAEIGRPMSPAASSHEWVRRVLSFWSSDPRSAWRLNIRKLAMMVSWREYPQLESTIVFGRLLGLVGIVPFWPFALLALPSLFGRWSEPLRAFFGSAILVLIVGTAIFFVVDRYRIHLVPWLIPLVALTLRRLAEALNARRFPRVELLRLTAATVILILPVPSATPAMAEWAVTADIGDRWANAGRLDFALDSYEKAQELVRRGSVVSGKGATGRTELLGFERNVAVVTLAAGDTARSIEAWALACRMDPEAWGPHCEHALLLALVGRAAEARGEIEGGRLPEVGIEAYARAAQAMEISDTVTASRWIETAVCLDSAAIAPREARIRLAIDRHRFERAIELLRTDAMVIGTASTDAHRAMLAWESGEDAEARTLLAKLGPDLRFTPPTAEMVQFLRERLSQPDFGAGRH